MPLVDSRMLGKLNNFYPSDATIQEFTLSQDDYGTPLKTWADKSGHVDIGAAVGPNSGQEIKRSDATISAITYIISLQGYYPLITASMRAVVSSVNYDILSVEHSMLNTVTHLIVERVI